MNSTPIGDIVATNLIQLSHEGHHATAWKGIVNNQLVIVKQHPVNTSDAEHLLQAWQTYGVAINKISAQTGIFAIPNLAYSIDREAGTITFVDKLAEQPDISQRLKDKRLSQHEKMKLVARLLLALGSIPYIGSDYRTEYMIDGEFSNFCARNGIGVDYIDLFPAHDRDARTGLLRPNAEHIEGSRSLALETFLTGDIYGIIGRFWGMLRRDQPSLWSLAQTDPTVKIVLDQLPSELKAYSEHLFKTDTAFVQSVYRKGLADPRSMALHTLLQAWKQRSTTPPPHIA